jgi:hypothetical protein
VGVAHLVDALALLQTGICQHHHLQACIHEAVKESIQTAAAVLWRATRCPVVYGTSGQLLCACSSKVRTWNCSR